MEQTERGELHDIIIDLRKAILEDNKNVREDVATQITRLYKLLRDES